jgi:hypothetical protein
MLLPGMALAIQEQAENRTITNIRTYGGTAVVFFEPNYVNSQNCENGAQNRFAFSLNTSGTSVNSEIYSSLLAAAVAGKSVTFYVEGCHSSNLSHPSIRSVDVKF